MTSTDGDREAGFPSAEPCLHCSGFGWRTIQSAVVLIRTPYLVLAVSRKHDHDDLGLPGGKIEPGETSLRCAVRELREETDLVVDPSKLRPVYDRVGLPVQPGVPPRVCRCYVVDDLSHVRNVGPDVGVRTRSVSREGCLVTWVPPARLLESSCTFHDYNRTLFAFLGIA